MPPGAVPGAAGAVAELVGAAGRWPLLVGVDAVGPLFHQVNQADSARRSSHGSLEGKPMRLALLALTISQPA